MAEVVKKTFVFLLVAFCLFYLVTRPEGAADAIKATFDGLMRFFSTLAS